MANFTNPLILNATYQRVATTGNSVLLQRLDTADIELVVADSMPAVGAEGHILSGGSFRSASFDGLGTTRFVYGRVKSSDADETAKIIVTAF